MWKSGRARCTRKRFCGSWARNRTASGSCNPAVGPPTVAIGIFPIATVGGPTAGLHEPDAVRLRAQDPQKRFRVHRARPDFHIVGLLQPASLLHPELRDFDD